VYQDWLLAEGDPRGELAVAPEAEAERLLRAHAPAWFGRPLRVGGRRVELLGEDGQGVLTARFERGHVRAIEVSAGLLAGALWSRGLPDWIEAALTRILAHPVGRLTSSVHISLWARERERPALFDALCHAGPLALRELRVTQFQGHLDDEIYRVPLPSLERLWGFAPWLEELELEGRDLVFGEVHHPRLRSLTLSAINTDDLWWEQVVGLAPGLLRLERLVLSPWPRSAEHRARLVSAFGSKVQPKAELSPGSLARPRG
jgi:hypothetical protein